MPLVNLAQQLGDAATLHREVRLRRRPLLDATTGQDDLLRHVFLIVDKIDDGTDVGRVEHGIVDKKQDRGGPKVLVFKRLAQPGANHRPRQRRTAALPQDLTPAQGVGYGEVGGGREEAVGRLLVQGNGEVGGADILSRADVFEPHLVQTSRDQRRSRSKPSRSKAAPADEPLARSGIGGLICSYQPTQHDASMLDRNPIPLFPLPVVVFPGQIVPLHIFEPRYKQMLADVRAADERGEDLPIGMILGADREVQGEVGCAMLLAKVLDEFDDGRLNIIVRGARRFRIARIAEGKPYLEAWVEYVDDAEEPTDPVLLAKAAAALEKLVGQLEEVTGARAEVGPLQSAFQIAQVTGLDLEIRQQLLEMTTENGRLHALCEYFDQMIPLLEAESKLHRLSSSNGHTGGQEEGS